MIVNNITWNFVLFQGQDSQTKISDTVNIIRNTKKKSWDAIFVVFAFRRYNFLAFL